MTRLFTPTRREQFLTLISTGRSVSEACDTVGISRNTVYSWRNEGRKEDAAEDKREFSTRMDDLLNGPPQDASLNDADLVRMLEAKARSGNVMAMKLLLERPWEKKTPKEKVPAPISFADELAKRRSAK